MREISDVMTTLVTSGFKVVFGLPLTYEGELEFMAMLHIENVVKSYRESHPVYGFLASFFKHLELNEITGRLSRIVYGYDEDYSVNIQRIISSVSGGR